MEPSYVGDFEPSFAITIKEDPSAFEKTSQSSNDSINFQRRWASTLSIISCLFCPCWCLSLPSIILACWSSNRRFSTTNQISEQKSIITTKDGYKSRKLAISIWISVIVLILGSLAWCFLGIAVTLHFEKLKRDRILKQFEWLN